MALAAVAEELASHGVDTQVHKDALTPPASPSQGNSRRQSESAEEVLSHRRESTQTTDGIAVVQNEFAFLQPEQTKFSKLSVQLASPTSNGTSHTDSLSPIRQHEKEVVHLPSEVAAETTRSVDAVNVAEVSSIVPGHLGK